MKKVFTFQENYWDGNPWVEIHEFLNSLQGENPDGSPNPRLEAIIIEALEKDSKT